MSREYKMGKLVRMYDTKEFYRRISREYGDRDNKQTFKITLYFFHTGTASQ